jgi:hypothetical protein
MPALQGATAIPIGQVDGVRLNASCEQRDQKRQHF